MEEKKNQPQQVSPEEQLDQLLASFLAEPELPEEEISENIPQDTLSQEAPSHLMAVEEPTDVSPSLPDSDALEASPLSEAEELEFDKIIQEAMRDEWDDPTVSPQQDTLEETAMDAEELPQEEDIAVPEMLQIGEDMDAITETEESPQEEVTMAQAPDPQPEEQHESRPTHKRRPKNRRSYGLLGIPHMISTVIWLAIIAFVGIGLGNMAWEVASDVLALGRPDHTITITIEEEDDLDSLATKLKQAGLIKYPGLFKFYGNITDCMDSIRTGSFQLNTQYDYHALVDQMSSNASRMTTKVTIPEGYNCAQIFALLEEKGVCSAAKLEEAAANADLGEYWFLEGVERGTPYCLEGYLFPDTYQFYYSHEPEAVLQKMLNNFNKRFTDIMKNKLDVLNQNLSDMMRSHGLSEEYIASHQMTIREVVIIASMIEKETANHTESYNISSVIYNRLTNPGVYPFLNIDAALVYVVGHSPLTEEDKKLDSPYNTYLYSGLIPGPICNPSRASLDAALDPEMTEYHFYAFNPNTGAHHFSKTYQEHLDFLASLN